MGKYTEKVRNPKDNCGRRAEPSEGMQLAGKYPELENVVQRLLITSKGDTITVMDVMKELHTDIFDKAGAVFEEAPFDGAGF
jgi:hypothetical protein